MFRHRLRLPALGRPVRLVLAASCFALAAVLALGSPSGGARGAGAVLVARHALAAGQVLRASDVRVVRWPRALAPPAALATLSAAVGRRLAAPITAGEPLVPQRLVGRDLAAGLGPEWVAMSVPVADARVTDFVHAGDRVDLYAVSEAAGATDVEPGTRQPSPVAQALHVLAVLPASPDGAQATESLGSSDAPVELVVAVARSDAGRIAGGYSSQRFAVVLNPP